MEEEETPHVFPPPPAMPPPEIQTQWLEAPAASDYQMIADKVGFVPNFRKDDNKFQLIFILCSMGVCALVAAAFDPTGVIWGDLALGAIAGLVLGLLVSGTILAVRGLRR